MYIWLSNCSVIAFISLKCIYGEFAYVLINVVTDYSYLCRPCLSSLHLAQLIDCAWGILVNVQGLYCNGLKTNIDILPSKNHALHEYCTHNNNKS